MRIKNLLFVSLVSIFASTANADILRACFDLFKDQRPEYTPPPVSVLADQEHINVDNLRFNTVRNLQDYARNFNRTREQSELWAEDITRAVQGRGVIADYGAGQGLFIRDLFGIYGSRALLWANGLVRPRRFQDSENMHYEAGDVREAGLRLRRRFGRPAFFSVDNIGALSYAGDFSGVLKTELANLAVGGVHYFRILISNYSAGRPEIQTRENIFSIETTRANDPSHGITEYLSRVQGIRVDQISVTSSRSSSANGTSERSIVVRVVRVADRIRVPRLLLSRMESGAPPITHYVYANNYRGYSEFED